MVNAFSSRIIFSIMQKWQDLAFRGVSYKVFSCLCFAVIYGCVHYFALVSKAMNLAPLPAPELAFFETAFGLLFLLPWTLSKGKEAFKVTGLSLYISRAFVVSLGIILWFMALSKMPLIEVTAFKYTAPVFTFLGAKFFLNEKCGWGRGVSIIIAFIGALMVAGHEFMSGQFPWTEGGFLILLPLGATACHALAAVFGKKQAQHDSPQTITLYLLILTLPILGSASLFEWVNPAPWQWPWLILMGGLLACAYISLSHAYVAADVTYLIPASFTRLVVAAFIGIAFFGEWPTSSGWLGLFLILGATASLCQYEARKLGNKTKLLKYLQEKVKRPNKPKISLVDDLLSGRHKEALNEQES
jgi:drug/metabolite transporter (DMT)-like permease